MTLRTTLMDKFPEATNDEILKVSLAQCCYIIDKIDINTEFLSSGDLLCRGKCGYDLWTVKPNR